MVWKTDSNGFLCLSFSVNAKVSIFFFFLVCIESQKLFMQDLLTNDSKALSNKMICAPSEDSDQHGHLPSLIRVFAVCSVGS